MDTKDQRSPTVMHRVEYALARTAITLLRLLPWRWSSAFGGIIARLAYRPFNIRRGVVERQIAAAFPELTRQQTHTIARRSYDSFGRTSIEAATLPGTPRNELLARFEEPEGWAYLEQALALGTGVILVTGHIGNWELGGAYVAARGIPLDAVARGMANPIFERYVNRTRQEVGMVVIHDKDAVRRTPRSLREGRAVVFVADHDALGLASTFVPFFGRPAKTPRGPAVFALRFGVPVLFAVAIRQPGGTYRMFIEPVPVEVTDDREADTDRIVLTFTQMLESYIRRFPEQYFWQHRRWRRQPPDTPEHLREP